MMKRVLMSILARVKGNVNANGTIAALTEIKKFFTTDGETRVYVSGRCVKYCIKQRLGEKSHGLSPLERRRRVVQSKGNPISFIDDDLFGFMITEAKEVARRRFAPIKTDGIVALKHCEITRDFAGRFDPTGKEMPSPFEVEVADFIGQNNWILTENIGRFEENELTDDIINASKTELEEKDEKERKAYYLLPDKRKERLKAFLEVLLKERYTFPRSATSLHQPQYYYAVILSTSRLLPLFSNIDYRIENGKVFLDMGKIETLMSLIDNTEKVTIIDFEGALATKVESKKKEESGKGSTEDKLEIVDISKINNVIDDLSKFLMGS